MVDRRLIIDNANDLVRFNGKLVPKKEAKSKLPKSLSLTAKNVLSKLNAEEYQTIKQLAKVLKVTGSAIGFGIRELLRYGYIWNLDEPRKRGVRYGLTAKGDVLAKELAKEADGVQESGLPWQWEHQSQTRLNHSKVKLGVPFPKDSPVEDRIAIAFTETDPFHYGDLVKVVMGKDKEEARIQFDARFSLIEKSGFVEPASGKSHAYQLTEKGIVWANAVSLAYQMATHCFNCGRRLLANEPGWDTATPRCWKCGGLSIGNFSVA